MGSEGKSRRRGHKTPLTLQQLIGMIASLQRTADHAVAGTADFARLRADRDALIIALAFFGFLRQSEVVAMDVSAVRHDTATIVIFLPWSKTDQDWMGSEAVIPSLIANINVSKLWLRHSTNMQAVFGSTWADDAPVFPRLRARDCTGPPRRLATDGAITDIVRTAMTAMYNDVRSGAIPFVPPPPAGASYASHSLRRGINTSVADSLSPEERCALARWADTSRAQPGYVAWDANKKAGLLRRAFSTS